MNPYLLFLGLFLFVCLVVVHELGHAIASRRNGVEVEEFGIGFPPRIWGKKLKKKTLLSINLLPIGGFVKLKGEHDADTEPGSYGAATLWVKTKIILAGVAMNLVVAWIMLLLVALIGMPQLFEGQFTVPSDTKINRSSVYVTDVESNSPASKFLQEKDELIALGPSEHALTYLSQDELSNITTKYPGQSVVVVYKRDGKTMQGTARLRTKQEVDASKNTDNPKGYLGIAQTEFTTRRSTWSAPIVATGVTAQFTALTYKGLGTAIGALFQGNGAEASGQVSGPLGLYVVLRDGSLLGLQFILMIVAVISLTLAIINVLPIPALDGGRLFVTLLFKAMKKTLNPRTEEIIHGVGFAVLMVLIVVVSVIDVKRFF